MSCVHLNHACDPEYLFINRRVCGWSVWRACDWDWPHPFNHLLEILYKCVVMLLFQARKEGSIWCWSMNLPSLIWCEKTYCDHLFSCQCICMCLLASIFSTWFFNLSGLKNKARAFLTSLCLTAKFQQASAPSIILIESICWLLSFLPSLVETNLLAACPWWKQLVYQRDSFLKLDHIFWLSLLSIFQHSGEGQDFGQQLVFLVILGPFQWFSFPGKEKEDW